ncbi:type I restriction endonuclease subunit R [Protaetiibacter intestinalis]|uniref:Type I restriction endonuclease subunit R n=1 Tax=Protaetiibacter intestinalis TaxID=2419774 RepID=A0A387BB49_9MICO|nr:type I restriction endonuclease [Protaetiibacter intestinalis]AYF99563.1 type I restriction endonuclease subunit R [Protaetiibacter intestinalis]
MAIHHESGLELEICEALESDGWLYSPTGKGYDQVRALYPEDVFAWLQESQPEEWAKVVKPTASAAEQETAKQQLLDRLVKTLDLPLDAGGGTLNVLRTGFKKTPASFAMCAFKPATSLNTAAIARYEAVRLRVMRQVHYSTKKKDSIDLVLFVNGLPVATLELKTENTQALADAITQYRHDRDPKGEPLLGFGNRALVHFAVSDDRVAMTTKLAGAATHFLPFDRGADGRSGNPVNPNGAASDYLWTRVLQRDAWLHILGKLLHLEKRTDTDPITGAVTKSTSLLFPRFHQWELVTTLLDAAREEGPGHRYLVQHSAGSGKTNSIAWLAHGLSTLHDASDSKVFDTVIVVTDRTVLDDQLQRAIREIEGVDGTVATINADEVRRAGDQVASKSGLLARELLSGKHIVIVTLQTFPFALEAIRNNAGLAGRRFAIIADEAHSSQTGEAAKKLKEVLTAEERTDVDDGADFDTEAVLAAQMAARADSPNLSFFAFTATPKAKTLELFGRIGDDGTPHPFHLYTMQQAIEEGYILDVLKNYTTYDTAFRVAERDQRRLQAVEVVDEAEATRKLMRWVSLHPTNIAQKVQIIVEHYRTNVRHLLDGHAKAMVVTSSREHAVRYKEAIDAYIAKKGYRMATLVAFSGTLTAEQVPGAQLTGVEPPYSEANLNSELRGRTLPAAFASDDFQILIVANKYQTGFDQPLLCAMYVDKRLSGVTAVQTLSRLNRTYPAAGKDTTFVLDFVNDPAEILTSFQPYFRDARLSAVTDVDDIHDIRSRLDAAGIYTDAEVDAFTEAYHAGATRSAHTAPLKAAADRFNGRLADAVDADHRADVEELELFRKNVGTFVRMYDFLSQIVDYGDTGLEKRSLYLRLLLPRLTGRREEEPIDFSAVELTHIKQARSGDHHLDLAHGETVELAPYLDAGSGAARDPRMVRLAEVLARINELFADEDFTPAEQQSWVEGLVTVLSADPLIRTQAVANTRNQFMESPDLGHAVTEAIITSHASHQRMTDLYFTRAELQVEMRKLLGELVHEAISGERGA